MFEPPTAQKEMKLREFVQKIRQPAAPPPPPPASPADEASAGLQSLAVSDAAPAPADAPAADAGAGAGERYYLQQTLVTGMGPQILADFRTVDWTGVHAWQARTPLRVASSESPSPNRLSHRGRCASGAAATQRGEPAGYPGAARATGAPALGARVGLGP